MTIQQYNAIELAYQQMQYLSYAQTHSISFTDYVTDVYDPKLAENFRKSWEWVAYLGLESVVNGE